MTEEVHILNLGTLLNKHLLGIATLESGEALPLGIYCVSTTAAEAFLVDRAKGTLIAIDKISLCSLWVLSCSVLVMEHVLDVSCQFIAMSKEYCMHFKLAYNSHVTLCCFHK